MPHVILDSGEKVAVADEAAQIRIQNSIDSLKAQVKAAKDAEEAAEAKADAAEAKAEEAEEKAKEAEDSLSRIEAADTLKTAKKIAGKEFTTDSTKPVDIKRKALDSKGVKCRKYGSWDKAPEGYVNAYFDAEEERVEEEETKDDDDDSQEQEANDSHRMFARALGDAKPAKTAQTTRDSAREDFLARRYGKKGA